MKRTKIAVVALALVSLTACGGSDPEPTDAAPAPAPASASAAAPSAAASSAAAPGGSAPAARNAADAKLCADANAALQDAMIKMVAKADGQGNIAPEAGREAMKAITDGLTALDVPDEKSPVAVAMRDVVAETEKLAAGADPLNADQSAFEAAGQRFEQACVAAGWVRDGQ